MQVEVIKNKQPKEFQPITLQVTIETKYELFGLWRRLALSSGEVNIHFDGSDEDTTSQEELCEMYNELTMLVDRELRPNGN